MCWLRAGADFQGGSTAAAAAATAQQPYLSTYIFDNWTAVHTLYLEGISSMGNTLQIT